MFSPARIPTMAWLRDVEPPGRPYFRSVRWEEDFERDSPLLPREIVVEGPAERPKWAHFICPCGCGARRSVNLMTVRKPSWQLTAERDGTITLWPSVWVDGQCGSHFWLGRSHVLWCD